MGELVVEKGIDQAHHRHHRHHPKDEMLKSPFRKSPIKNETENSIIDKRRQVDEPKVVVCAKKRFPKKYNEILTCFVNKIEDAVHAQHEAGTGQPPEPDQGDNEQGKGKRRIKDG